MSKTKVHKYAAQRNKPNSRVFFKLHWVCWKILGATLDFEKGHKYKSLYFLCSAVLNITFSICYPIHLAMELFRSDSMSGNIRNLDIFFTVVACSTKFFTYAINLSKIRKMEDILELLDTRIKSEGEINFFADVRHRMRNIGVVFACFYSTVCITAGLSSLLRGDRSLMYPARFPFDWSKSTLTYALANIYQFSGAVFLLLQNYVDDTFPAMALCLLSGHIQVLSVRVASIGYDDKSQSENEAELKQCIKDQQTLYELFASIEHIISLPIFLQFSVSAASICLACTALLFYATALIDIVYYVSYSLCILLQTFPTCYYGSDSKYNFDQLHYSIYESNWTEQSARYKKHMILFTERSLRPNCALAGGMVRIHLDTFISACRAAYSLMAVVRKFK